MEPCVRERPDVAKKLLERKLFKETVVKCKLQKLVLAPDRAGKEKTITAIQKRVDGFSKRVHIASLSLNLLMREAFNDIPTCILYAADLPNIFDQTFIRQLIVGVEGALKPHPAIKQLFENHSWLQERLQSIPRHSYDLNIMTAGAKKFLTNLKNHFTTQLTKWIKKWVYSDYVRCQLSHLSEDEYYEVAKTLLYYLHNWKQSSDGITAALDNLPDKLSKYVSIQKSILGSEPIDAKWFDETESLKRMVKYAVFYNRFQRSVNCVPKLIPLSPICRIKNHFITLDKEGLKGLLKDTNYLKEFPEQMDKEWTANWWKSLLKIHCLEGKESAFTNTVETDGLSVCVHFKRPRMTSQQSEDMKIKLQKLLKDPSVVVIGVDPGRSNILFAAFKDTSDDKDFHHIALTRRHYYQTSGIWKANKQSNSWNMEVKEYLEQLSKVTTSGDTLEGILAYLEIWSRVESKLRDHLCQNKWSNQRLRLYGGKKRVFADFFNKLESKVKAVCGSSSKIVVSYGSAHFAPGGSGEVSVPTSRAFQECSNRFRTQYVDEFRTTAVWWEDPNIVLKKVMRADTRTEVRGLHWCESTNGICKLLNRDLNAAINIRNCLIGPRHENMKRSPNQGKIRKQIGHWLAC